MDLRERLCNVPAHIGRPDGHIADALASISGDVAFKVFMELGGRYLSFPRDIIVVGDNWHQFINVNPERTWRELKLEYRYTPVVLTEEVSRNLNYFVRLSNAFFEHQKSNKYPALGLIDVTIQRPLNLAGSTVVVTAEEGPIVESFVDNLTTVHIVRRTSANLQSSETVL